MSEYVEQISKEDLIKYWETFFEGKLKEEEINNMLEAVSNTNFERIIDQNRIIDTSVLDSIIWGKVKNEEVFQDILKFLSDKNCWVYFFEPILKKYVDEFIDLVNESDIIYDKNLFLIQAISSVLSQLNQIAYQSIIVELYYAKKANLLVGNSKEERGSYFLNVLLRDDEYRNEVYTNYPELIRMLDVKTQYSIEFISKIINDTKLEIHNIESALNDKKKLGKIREIHLGEGDTHNRGKSVAKLVFDTGVIILYKPHHLENDERYYEFIQWVNSLNIVGDVKEKLLAVKVYTTEDSGWAECIKHIPCENEKELNNFYYRIGRMLCLLHTLNGNDMHYENVIAHKDMPVLIDLETIIHPDVDVNTSLESAIEKAMKEVKQSVTSTHLLPAKIINSKTNKVLEIGGLGATKSQESPFKGKFIENYGTDEVRVVKRYGDIEPQGNNPVYNENTVEAKDYENEIVNGFRDMYKWILANKELYSEKIKYFFGDIKVRILYRATNVYAQLLFGSFHPDLLTNYADRFIFLHRVTVDYKDKKKDVLEQEINELLQCDIPLFNIAVNEKVHEDSDKTIFDDVLNKIEAMSETKMYRQIAAIHTSFMSDDYTGHIESKVKFNKDGKRKYTSSKLDRVAFKIGEYILQRSITGEKDGVNSRTWLETQDSGLGFSVYNNSSGDIYSGLGGLALFYNYLWIISKEEKYRAITEEIVESIIQTLPMEDYDIILEKIKTGAFNGLGGVAYILSYIDKSNNTNKYRDKIERILDIIDKSKKKDDEVLDIINSVGNLGIMISLYESIEDNSMKKKVLNIANVIVDRIVDNKKVIKDFPGTSWSEKGFSGYSHGNAGIIVQLYRWYNITNDEEVLKIIKDALLFERSLFSEEDKDWYRGAEQKYFSWGWCHGAPGILLSKIQLKKLGYKDEKINDEIKIAIDTVIRKGLSQDISLCHGDMGNMVILKEAAMYLEDEKLYAQTVATIEDISDFVMDLLESEELKEREFNGFMVGLSGIGYELLRINRENELPNILSLE